jgi:hypothetical protein
MKSTIKSANGTSFHDTTFRASVAAVRQILGQPQCEQNDGRDKVNFDWTMETDDGTIFTVYDWKEYRALQEGEIIEWHVGGKSRSDTEKALTEIIEALNLL